jgi:hypothetical protein
VVRVRTFGRFALIGRTTAQRVGDANRLDDQDLVLDVDVTFGRCAEPPFARVDAARLQRAAQGAGQSTGGGGDDVIEGGGVLGILAGSSAVVLTHRSMRSEGDIRVNG